MFPSPYGDFVFQLMKMRESQKRANGFRPLTGILFFNAFIGVLYSYGRIPFPSPYGDFVFQSNRGCKYC